MQKTLLTAIITCLVCVTTSNAAEKALPPAKKIPFYIGTYTQGHFKGKGIYLADLDTATGEISEPKLVAECDSPAFLVDNRVGEDSYIYAVGETWTEGKGPIYAFKVNKNDSTLTKLNEITIPGTGPTHLCICDNGGGGLGVEAKNVLVVACYGSGNVVSLPILPDGKLGEVVSSIKHEGSGPNKARQNEPHPHGVYQMPIGKSHYNPNEWRVREIAVPDLGTDKIFLYEVDTATAKMTPAKHQKFIELPPGSGPRHLAFTGDKRDGTRIYCVNELDSTVSFIDGDVVQTVSTLPKEITDSPEKLKELNNTTAEIILDLSN
ncbi:MAG: lactonase family protein, partial [Thermoguttaceae bacterium]